MRTIATRLARLAPLLLAWSLAGCVRVSVVTPAVPTDVPPAPTATPAPSRTPLPTWTPGGGGVVVQVAKATGRTATPEATPTDHPTLDARVLADVTLPGLANVSPGERVVKTWRVQNAGSLAWPEGTRLQQVSGERDLSGTTPLLPLVSVGTKLDVQVTIDAPERPGTYQARWQLTAPDGEVFGEELVVSLLVVAPATATPTPVPRPTDTPVPPTPAATPTAPPLASQEVFFTYEWESGWLGFENEGVWIELSDNRYYVGEIGLVDAEWVTERMHALGLDGWRFKIVVHRGGLPLEWSPRWVDHGARYAYVQDGAQRVITNHIHLDDWRWRTYAERWLAGGLDAVVREYAYWALQEAVFAPLQLRPSVPCLGFHFAEQ